MNGARKFHKATGPAFNVGEVWVGSSGHKVTVVSVRAFPMCNPNHSPDYGVTYEWVENGEVKQHEKDCWNFQVRYSHVADSKL